MTAKDFIEKVQAYYGQRYTPGMAPVIAGWLVGKSGAFLDVLFDEVTSTLSTAFKALPDKELFERCLPTVLETITHRASLAIVQQDKPEDYASAAEIEAFWASVRELRAKKGESWGWT